MITFNDLRISLDGKYILIDASIEPYDTYSEMYIESVSIVTDEQYSDSGSTAPAAYSKEFDDHPRRVSLRISADELDGVSSLDRNIFYVYVNCGGTVKEESDCGWDSTTSIGAVLYWLPIYRIGINHMRRTVDRCCSLDKEFIDYILRLKSFELALRTGNYVLANENFRKWFIQKPVSSVQASPCKNC